MPALLKSDEPRIVNVSSIAHTWGPKEGILFDKINDPNAMNNWSRYGQSKLANVLFTRGLFNKYSNKGLLVNSTHPGAVDTELERGVKESMGLMWYAYYPFQQFMHYFLMLTPLQGALTSLYCATSPEVAEKKINNKYFIPIATLSDVIDIGKSDELADKLMKFTEDLVNEKLK